MTAVSPQTTGPAACRPGNERNPMTTPARVEKPLVPQGQAKDIGMLPAVADVEDLRT